MNTLQKRFLLTICCILVLFSAITVWYSFDLQSTITTLHEKIKRLEVSLSQKEKDNQTLSEALLAEKTRNDNFEEQIKDITGTVDILEKLSKTDKELLQKYSRVYFLNEHYIPENLSTINKDYTVGQKEIEIHSKVRPYLTEMLEDMKKEGLDPSITSGYRSYETQKSIITRYRIVYGTGANTFSADQGYSEHQLGTTVDITTNAKQGVLDGFEKTKEYEWLTQNAYKYGFILSYPQGNSYYIFEPWHWRFVGKDLARYLHREKLNFYDLEQRKIDAYLVDIFD